MSPRYQDAIAVAFFAAFSIYAAATFSFFMPIDLRYANAVLLSRF